MFQLTIPNALNPIPESSPSGLCHAMPVTIITLKHMYIVMFKCYDDDRHPMVEE